MGLLYFQAKPSEEKLPSSQNPPTHGQKLNQIFQQVIDELEHVLEGYILPEPYFSVKLKSAVEGLIQCLKDASLPMLELQVKMFKIFLLTLKAPVTTIVVCFVICLSF